MIEDVPAEVREAARRAFADRDVQAQVLPLTYDSLLAKDAADGPRRLTFTDAAGAEVTVTVHRSGPGEVQLGITSVGCSLVEVSCGGAVLAGDAARGTLTGPTPHGLFSAILESADNRRLRTSWIRI